MGSFSGPLVHCENSIRVLVEVQNVSVRKIKVIVEQSMMVQVSDASGLKPLLGQI
jgi:hypothetical protein